MSITILGGGLSGLSAAYYLSKINPKTKITLIEATNRLGGWIKSDIQENGIIFERAARTIRPKGETGENTLQLVQELNLENEIKSIPSNHPAALNRMIYAKNKLHLLPSSISGLFKKQELFSKPLIMLLANDLLNKSKNTKDEPIYDFISRRFGDEIADYLISPLLCGICAGNSKEISVNFLMKNLFEYEQKYGSISNGLIRNVFKKHPKKEESCELVKRAKREKWNVYSFRHGLETLPKALEKRLENNNVNILLNTECKEINFTDGKVSLTLDNTNLQTDRLISTIPAHNLSNLFHKHSELSNLLKMIKSVSVAVVNLQYDKPLLTHEGFGLLIAPKEKLPILGVIYDSCCFSYENCTVLTVMLGGYWFEEYLGNNPDEEKILGIVSKELERILNIHQKPTRCKVNILKNCIPQYVVGHNETVTEINGYIDKNNLPLSLCGASYNGVGVNDVILSAKKAVDRLR